MILLIGKGKFSGSRSHPNPRRGFRDSKKFGTPYVPSRSMVINLREGRFLGSRSRPRANGRPKGLNSPFHAHTLFNAQLDNKFGNTDRKDRKIYLRGITVLWLLGRCSTKQPPDCPSSLCKMVVVKLPKHFRVVLFQSIRNKLCGRPPQYTPAPWKLTVDMLTLKVVSESRVTWATSVPILVFLGLSVLNLGPMYATDRRQTSSDVSRASLLINASIRPIRRGIINDWIRNQVGDWNYKRTLLRSLMKEFLKLSSSLKYSSSSTS